MSAKVAKVILCDVTSAAQLSHLPVVDVHAWHEAKSRRASSAAVPVSVAPTRARTTAEVHPASCDIVRGVVASWRHLGTVLICTGSALNV